MPFKPTSYLPYDFANRRHIGPSKDEIKSMLKIIGAETLDQLIDDTLPEGIKQNTPLNWERPKS